RDELVSLVATVAAAVGTLEGVVLLMSDANAFALGLMAGASGSPVFPTVGAAGGAISGVPVITSSTMGSNIVAVHAPSVLLADEGGMDVDLAEHATVQMDTAPTQNSATPVATQL